MMNMMKVYDLTDDGSGVNYYDHRGTISIHIQHSDCQSDYCLALNCITKWPEHDLFAIHYTTVCRKPLCIPGRWKKEKSLDHHWRCLSDVRLTTWCIKQVLTSLIKKAHLRVLRKVNLVGMNHKGKRGP